MSDYNAYQAVRDWGDYMEGYLRDEIESELKSGEPLNRVIDNLYDRLYEQCDPDWTIYTFKSWKVAAEFYSDEAANELFTEYSYNSGKDLNELVSLFCHCLALSLARSILNDLEDEYKDWELEDGEEKNETNEENE